MSLTINSTDISTHAAKLIDRKFSNHEVINVYDWLDGASSPVHMRDYQTFKDISITLLISSTSDAEAIVKADKLIELCKHSVLKFSDISFFFSCHFEGKFEMEKLKNGVLKLVINLMCNKTYLPEVTTTAAGVDTVAIANSGTLASEMYISITPTEDISEFTITGLSATPIKVQNLTADKPHVIDGYTYKFLADGANDIGNYNAFEFPVLPTGTTNVGFSHTTANVVLKYYPKFN